MSDHFVPPSERPSGRSPRPFKFFPVIDDLADEATGEVPAINGNSLHQREGAQGSRMIQLGQKEEMPPLPLVVPQYEKLLEMSTIPVIETPPKEYGWRGPSDRNLTWKPGTFGFDGDDNTSPFERENTFS